MIAAIMLAIMLFFITIGAAMRYFFNKPILGDFELIQFMLGLLVAFGLAYTSLQKGHVRVELLISRLSTRLQRIFESIVSFLCLALLAVMIWQNTIYIKNTYDSWVNTQSLHIPHFPFIAILSLGLIAFFGAVLLDLINSIFGKTQK